ncbi:MAG TPA: hypothetical protein VHU19_14430 [Pyrinomonadaceae bacterium]|jgi:hypothetical protein|nr:hypothetical protein [Pyrinomonadaceae bacterium]
MAKEKPQEKVVNITFQLKGASAEDFEAVKSAQFAFIASDATIAKKLMLERLYQLKPETAGARQ